MTDHETAKDDRLERGREILKQIGGPDYDGCKRSRYMASF